MVSNEVTNQGVAYLKLYSIKEVFNWLLKKLEFIVIIFFTVIVIAILIFVDEIKTHVKLRMECVRTSLLYIYIYIYI